MKRGKCGFTLFEVMVTCGIIVILVSLTYPIVGRALMSGKETHTKNNLRQIYLGLMVYREQYDSKVDYGNTTDMGLPYDLPKKETALSVVPNVQTWRSRCCCHVGASTGYPEYTRYFIDYSEYFHDTEIWKIYVEKFQDKAVAVFDLHCNSSEVDVVYPRSVNVKAIGVYLNGKIETRVRNSLSPRDIEYFWNY